MARLDDASRFSELGGPTFLLGVTGSEGRTCGIAASMALMLTLFARFGYVRLLGLGHIPWLFTVPWLWLRLGEVATRGLFYYWLLTVVLLDSISLMIDAVDVIRYGAGEHQSTITTTKFN